MTSQIITDYNAGMPLKDLRAKYLTTSIYYNKGIVPNRKNKLTENDHQEIITMYQQGERVQDITNKYEISKTKLKIILKGYGVAMRKSGHSGRKE